MPVDLEPIAIEPSVLVSIWLFMMWPAVLLSCLVMIFVLTALRTNKASSGTRASAALMLLLTVGVTGIMPVMQSFGTLENQLAANAGSLPFLSLIGLVALLANAGTIIYFSSSMGGSVLTTADWQHLGSALSGAKTMLAGITKVGTSGNTLTSSPSKTKGDTVMNSAAGKPTFASLRMMVGQKVGTVHDVSGTSDTRIGREPQHNEVVVQDARVSAQHAKIRPEKGGYVLFDLGSANGSFVNGIKVEGSHALANQDRVQFGDTVYLFQVAQA